MRYLVLSVISVLLAPGSYNYGVKRQQALFAEERKHFVAGQREVEALRARPQQQQTFLREIPAPPSQASCGPFVREQLKSLALQVQNKDQQMNRIMAVQVLWNKKLQNELRLRGLPVPLLTDDEIKRVQ